MTTMPNYKKNFTLNSSLKIEKEKKIEQESNEPESNKQESNKQEDSVFASFKSYNQKKNSGGISTVGAKKVENNNNNEDIVLKDRINSYRFGGKLHEFVDLEKHPASTEKKIDFTTFKQMTENKKSL